MTDDGMTLVIVVCAFVLGFFIGTAYGERTDWDISKYFLAEDMCESNGGVKKVDHFNIVCENGAKFKIRTLEVKE